MTAFRHFTEIGAWQESRQLSREVFRLTADHPVGDAPFRDQLRRAAVSVMANIAEGYGRGSDAQFLRHLDIARGSAAEVEALLILASDLEPVIADRIAELRRRLDRCAAMLAKLTTYLRSSRAESASVAYAGLLAEPKNHGTSGLPDFRTSGLLT